MQYASEIGAAVDLLFEDEVAFLAELVSLPSLRGQEATAQDFMADQFRTRGYDVDQWRIEIDQIAHLPGFSPVVGTTYDNAFNVVASHRPRRKTGRSLILNGHIDVVPVGPLDMWTTPPFQPRIQDGWMYGRGAGDMKAGLAANLFALDALRHCGLQPAAEVYQQSVVEEECTGNGALACLQRGYRADAALISEPTASHLSVAQVGVIWMQLTVRGTPAHAAYASEGFNAIEAIWPISQALHRLEAEWNAERPQVYIDHDVAHPLNFVISGIEGGDWTSSVPAWCTINIRIGIYPDTDVESKRAEVERVIALAARDNPQLSNNPPQIVYHGFLAPGYALPRGTAQETALAQAHRAVHGGELPTAAFTALTDARFFGLYQDTPALVYGPRAEFIHGFDERVDLESLRQVTKTIALFVADWCGVEPVSA